MEEVSASQTPPLLIHSHVVVAAIHKIHRRLPLTKTKTQGKVQEMKHISFGLRVGPTPCLIFRKKTTFIFEGISGAGRSIFCSFSFCTSGLCHPSSYSLARCGRHSQNQHYLLPSQEKSHAETFHSLQFPYCFAACCDEHS